MSITRIHSFLVHPSKKEADQPPVRGAPVPLQGKLFRMLSDLYAASERECDIDILFRSAADGSQHNECRDVLIRYRSDPDINNGRAIAERLQRVTTLRSGLGLLFLVTGRNGQDRRLLIARFPADQGVIAQERAQRLDVEFIERVFMKSSKAYKSALYSSRSDEGGFWDGKAIDKQINQVRELSNYWIGEFLDSELRTTGPAGTKRLAVALRQALHSTTDTNLRTELLSIARLLPGQNRRRISAEGLLRNLGTSDTAIASIKSAFPRHELFAETFQFDREEYNRHIQYRSIELDNGALLIAENERFETVFQTQNLRAAEGRVRYSTEGKVVRENLRKTI